MSSSKKNKIKIKLASGQLAPAAKSLIRYLLYGASRLAHRVTALLI